MRTVLRSWGPGKFDAAAVPRRQGVPARRQVRRRRCCPPAFGLAGVNLHTYTGWGGVTHWNAFVANLEMHGQGTFFDPRLNDATQVPGGGASRIRRMSGTTPDLITAKLPALHFYQLVDSRARSRRRAASTPAPPPAGKTVFNGAGRCATCHVPPLFTEPGWNMHTAAEIGIDDFQAKRSPDERYRTTPLAGLFARQKGGFYHDGRFADLRAVVDHYDRAFGLNLSEGDKRNLVEDPRSL